MKRAQPVAVRVDSISRQFLGRPYVTNPLIGSADTPETFIAGIDGIRGGFDCVTYVETVIARAYARNTKDYASFLRRIRYESGRVDWKRRNHYMTNWIRNNARAGLVQPVNFGSRFDYKTTPAGHGSRTASAETAILLRSQTPARRRLPPAFNPAT